MKRGKAIVFIENPYIIKIMADYHPDLKVDWLKFRKFINNEFGEMTPINFYMAESDITFKFRQFIGCNGFTIISKKPRLIQKNGGQKLKCNFDIEIGVDAYRSANSRKFNCVILIAGDSDYIYLISEIRKMGIWTIIIGSEKNTPLDLKNSADEFISWELKQKHFTEEKKQQTLKKTEDTPILELCCRQKSEKENIWNADF